MPLVSIDALVAGVQAGQLVSFPTDTVPALATKPDRAELIFLAKQRTQDKPLILMGANPGDLWPYVQGDEEEWLIWQQVAEQYWPGALTLVLPASDRVPVAMNPLEPTTIGLRIPNHAIAQKILAQTGPLATTSANLSGQPPLQTTVEIAAQFPQVLALDPNELKDSEPVSAIPSTVAKWCDRAWHILRPGGVQLANSHS